MLEKLTAKQKKWIDTMFRSLTEEEKIGQLVNEQGTIVRSGGPSVEEWLKRYPIGSIFTGSEVIEDFSEKNGQTTNLQQAVAKTKTKVPVLFCGDFENGIGDGIEGFTTMPRTMGLSATFSEKDYYDYGRIIGTEGRALNIRWGFGPVSDLNLNRENPVTNIRSASDDPDHAIKVLSGIVKGMQDHGVAACPKHFPGDGTDTRNQHYVTSHNVLSKKEWDRLHGRVFRELVKAGAMSIMIGHVAFPAYEPEDRKRGLWRPATCSKKIMTDLLRGELGFDGIIVSDALSMAGYLSWGDYETRILDSFNGGVDIFLWPDPAKFFPLMKAALKDGRASKKRLDESVKRILAFKALLGLMPDEIRKEKEVDLKALIEGNRKAAVRISEDSITLLRNRDNTLPLKLKKGARILLFFAPDLPGPNKYLQKFAVKLTARGFRVTVAHTRDFGVLSSLLDTFDSVMYLSDANPQYSVYRGFDNILWSYIQHMPQMKKPIMISFGTPYFLYDVASVPTYINAYHDCENSLEATIKAIFGEIPFKGKSPVSVPNCFLFGDGLKLKK